MDASRRISRKKRIASSAILAVTASVALGGAPSAEAASGTIVLEAEHYSQSVSRTAGSWVAVNEDSASNGIAMNTYEVRGVKKEYLTKSPRLDYKINFSASGKYYLWLRTIMPSSGSNSIIFGLNNDPAYTRALGGGVDKSYRWLGAGTWKALEIPSAGTHTLSLWVREDGMIVDQIVVTGDRNFQPPASGAPLDVSGSEDIGADDVPIGDSVAAGGPGPSGSGDESPLPSDGGSTDSGLTESAADSNSGAVDDYVMTDVDDSVRIVVRRNDYGFDSNNYKVRIVKKPRHASSVSVGRFQHINYRPALGFVGRDSLVYRLTDGSGFRADAVVTIDVGCSPCEAAAGSVADSSDVVPVTPPRTMPTTITLKWDGNAEGVDGYRINYGPSVSAAILQLARISVTTGQVDPNAPYHVIYPTADLGLSLGDTACFTVQAFNAGGESAPSEAVCTVL